MELYKYTGSVAVLTVRFGKAETVTPLRQLSHTKARSTRLRSCLSFSGSRTS